jgi:hypothetical protein
MIVERWSHVNVWPTVDNLSKEAAVLVGPVAGDSVVLLVIEIVSCIDYINLRPCSRACQRDSHFEPQRILVKRNVVRQRAFKRRHTTLSFISPVLDDGPEII